MSARLPRPIRYGARGPGAAGRTGRSAGNPKSPAGYGPRGTHPAANRTRPTPGAGGNPAAGRTGERLEGVDRREEAP
ncbi:hypothetical protein [Rhizohabitans arisaemae]|uniref:hypothetical protein n=1 Tax=Rhizohabitans arisaemae TaxID=2720610 RepID=UPI0024B0E089|nr:hypothetical protein [Rhizohabitans arisaemae]